MTFHVVVNHSVEHLVDNAKSADRLCDELAKRSVFTARASIEPERDPSMELIVESGRAYVFYLHLEDEIKLTSRDASCMRRGTVSLRNDEYPELDLDQIELQYRALIPPARAIAIFRHFLKTGIAVELVPWPADDEDEWD